MKAMCLCLYEGHVLVFVWRSCAYVCMKAVCLCLYEGRVLMFV